MTDRILATISILTFIAFMGIVVWFVAEPDLTIIVVVVILFAVYDFWDSMRDPDDFARRHKD